MTNEQETLLAAWHKEGEELFNRLSHASLTFALGFAIGKWWGRKP
jgi:hypothetical protein